MKKKILFIAFTLVLGMFVMPNVFAAEEKTASNYEGFKTAVNDLKATGGTIRLENEITVDSSYIFELDQPNLTITIDMNGKNIVANDLAYTFGIKKGQIKFTGEGTIENKKAGSNMGSIYVIGSKDSSDANYSHLIIDKDVTLEGQHAIVFGYYGNGEGEDVSYGAVADIYGHIVTNVKGSADSSSISVHGNIKNTTNAPIININSGATIENTVDNATAIYQAGYSTINISNATVEGQTGIITKAGKLNLENATITATGDAIEKTEVSDDGYNESGAAIQIESNPNYAGAVEISINGGNYTSANNSAILEYGETEDSETTVESITIIDGTFQAAEDKPALTVSKNFIATNSEFINGGEFLSGDEASDVSAYIASGLIQDENGNVVVPVQEEEKNPDTADTNVYGLLTIILVSGLGLGYVIRKRMN